MKIIAFSGSNSSQSINFALLEYIKSYHLPEMEILDARKMNVPMYGIDAENESGIPSTIQELYQQIQSADVLLVACTEHNGNYTSYFKSTMDWLSRLDYSFVNGKTIYLVGTSTGRGGAGLSIQATTAIFERFKANVMATFSLPSYNHAFEEGRLLKKEEERLTQFISQIKI
jgi:chromate reductase, NAD(P)H dehydrogenase (quinone)